MRFWRSTKAALLVLFCFAFGALLTILAVQKLRAQARFSVALTRSDAVLAEACEAERREAWNAPPERNVRDLLERSRRDFPDDRRFHEVAERVTARLLTLATSEQQAGHLERALSWARLAQEIEPENASAVELLRALTATSVVPSAAMPSAAPFRVPRHGTPRRFPAPSASLPPPPVSSSEGVRWL